MARYSPEAVARSRQAIRDSAAKLFRSKGYLGVGIDEVCNEAGLTRGTFYSHFPSKADLLTAVLGGAHDFVARLKARTARTTVGLNRQAAKVATDYLAPQNKAAVARGCSLASLAVDAMRSGPEAQAAYADAVEQVVAEMRRGADGAPSIPADQARAALALCVGGLLISNACGEAPTGRKMARAASRQVKSLLSGGAA